MSSAIRASLACTTTVQTSSSMRAAHSLFNHNYQRITLCPRLCYSVVARRNLHVLVVPSLLLSPAPTQTSASTTTTIPRPSIFPTAPNLKKTMATVAHQAASEKDTEIGTATKIHLSPISDTGIFSTKIRPDSAEVTSALLQENHEEHHIFFNNLGFHNHIVHHLLTIYAIGASPETIKAAYVRGKSYQRPAMPANEGIVKELYIKEHFMRYLGKEEVYAEFMTFFEKEIQEKGVSKVVKDYLFAGDDRAEALFRRLYSGLLHPFIHLGFAIEFNQPAILAEALAQTAVHEDYIAPLYLVPAEKAAGGVGKRGEKTLLHILDEIHADKKLASSAHWSDRNKFKDGVMTRAPDEMIKYASQFTISGDQLEEKNAELVNLAVYFSTASQHPPKEVKIDFFYLHCVTSSIFLSKFISLPFLDLHSKTRLLEWKGRMDLIMYVSRGAPDLSLQDVVRHPTSKDWNTIFSESAKHPKDDSHLSKMERAVAHGERVCRPFEGRAKEIGLMITGDMWLKIANMGKILLAQLYFYLFHMYCPLYAIYL
ncbi:hypothetical protein MAP00_004003 [Monascus purpureus]|nr:hypothetical protein MAP00_004003 [Monascus purpureus]